MCFNPPVNLQTFPFSPVLTKHDDLNVGFFFHPAKVMQAMKLKQFLTSYIHSIWPNFDSSPTFAMMRLRDAEIPRLRCVPRNSSC